MYLLALFLLVTTASPEPTDAPVSDPAPTEEPRPCDEVEETQEGVRGLKNDMLGLEFFLLDKKEHKTYCPYTKWEQPTLEEYKKDPKSYLPEDCKAEKI